ncbi:hypothetical protein C8F04DRAFT_99066 [Mycena alexandri]|uniref:Uncharacterized protein n=1 Tax=Mycena alexandri TaxID=1745969 RepID=A0AAD6XEJ0_9AGAR|nr:hypothetical protein C8F04DRAFT_99066 [Mycena alexandri]
MWFPSDMVDPHPVLVSGFLILSKRVRNGLEILVYSIASFTGHWCPLSNLTAGSSTGEGSPTAPAPLVRHRVDYGNAWPASIRITAHASVLDADTTIISLYAELHKPRRGFLSLLFPRATANFQRYRLAPGSWSLLETGPSTPHLSLGPLTYSGYAIGGVRNAERSIDPQNVVRMRGTNTGSAPVVRANGTAHASLAPYGGTLLTLGGGWLQIAYYQ